MIIFDCLNFSIDDVTSNDILSMKVTGRQLAIIVRLLKDYEKHKSYKNSKYEKVKSDKPRKEHKKKEEHLTITLLEKSNTKQDEITSDDSL